jgi:hypothetical protein
MLKFTAPDGSAVYLAHDSILSVAEPVGSPLAGALIVASGGPHFVRETVAQVMERINGYSAR